MSNNWKTYKLKEIANLSTGFAFKSKDYDLSGNLKVIRGKNITEGYLRWNNDARYWNHSVEKLEKYFVELDDIVIGMDGSKIGKNRAIVREGDLPSILAQRVGRVQAIEGVSCQKFLWQLINNDNFENYVDTVKTGTSIPHISLGQIGDLELELPPLKEQTQIANNLSAIDDKIENNLATNKTLEDMAMALYKHWFVDFGPFQDGEFIDSELGLIPKGWEVKRLEELGKMYYGKMPKKDKIQTTGFPLYSGYRLVGHYPEFNCKKGKVIVLARGVGGTGDIKMTKTDLFLTNISICIENDLEIISDLILFYILKSTGLHYLRTGSAQPQITINDLNSVQLIIPSKEIQNEFLESFKSLIDKKEENIIENENLSKLRDTLLPKLISGEVRLKEFREQVENLV
jgi:type I restriction enzyme S subunit